MIDQLPRSATYVNPERSGVGRHSYVPRLSTPSHDNITYQRDESGETISQNGPPRIKLQVLESHRHLAPVVSQVASFVAGAPSAAAVGRSTISAVVTLLSTYGAKFAAPEVQRTTVGGVNLTWLRADGFEVEIEFEPSGAAPLILVDEDDVIDAGRLGTADGEALLRRALAGFRRQ